MALPEHLYTNKTLQMLFFCSSWVVEGWSFARGAFSLVASSSITELLASSSPKFFKENGGSHFRPNRPSSSAVACLVSVVFIVGREASSAIFRYKSSSSCRYCSLPSPNARRIFYSINHCREIFNSHVIERHMREFASHALSSSLSGCALHVLFCRSEFIMQTRTRQSREETPLKRSFTFSWTGARNILSAKRSWILKCSQLHRTTAEETLWRWVCAYVSDCAHMCIR